MKSIKLTLANYVLSYSLIEMIVTKHSLQHCYPKSNFVLRQSYVFYISRSVKKIHKIVHIGDILRKSTC